MEILRSWPGYGSTLFDVEVLRPSNFFFNLRAFNSGKMATKNDRFHLTTLVHENF